MQHFKSCAAPECRRNAHRSENGKRGYCSMHYQRVKKFGDHTIVKKVPSPAIDWIEEHKLYFGLECLKWPFYIAKDGYGRAHYPNGLLTTASRIMCIAAHGEPPTDGHQAAHSCGKGNQGCVNPKHLYWATIERNHADKLAHGTHCRGTRHLNSRLTESDISTIRRLLETHSQLTIARMFGVDQSHISRIKTGDVWGWLKAA
jgi:hypothetical protein